MAIENVLEAYGSKVVGSHVEVGGSGGAGHTIVNPSGTEMDQEDKLQFMDAGVADDSTNGKTKVSIVREMTKAQYDTLSETERKGVIRTTDEPDIVIGDVVDDKVEVEATTQTTFSALLNELWTKLDITKVSETSCIRMNTDYFVPRRVQNNWLIFSGFRVSNTHAYYETISLEPNNSALYLATYTKSSGSWTIEEETTSPSTTKITLYYGTKSAPIELTTDAEHCMMSDGESVESAVNKSKWSNLITLNAKVQYRYNDNLLIVYPTGTETSLGTWSTVTLGTLPTNIFTILNNANSNGIIDGSSHTLKRGTFLVNVSGEVKLTAWEDALTGGSQTTIGNSGIIVPIQLV